MEKKELILISGLITLLVELIKVLPTLIPQLVKLFR